MAVNSDGAQGATEGAKGAHLGRRSLGVADIVFFVVAASAPLTVVAGGVPTSFAVTNAARYPARVRHHRGHPARLRGRLRRDEPACG